MTLQKRSIRKECRYAWGAPGLGKTREVHATEDSLYIKLANKWWDGYKGQKAVLIDDLGVDKGKALTDHLKLWMDPWYNQPGETKGGMVALNYDRLYITSNHGPQELWQGVDLEAMKRRMITTHYDKLN